MGPNEPLSGLMPKLTRAANNCQENPPEPRCLLSSPSAIPEPLTLRGTAVALGLPLESRNFLVVQRLRLRAPNAGDQVQFLIGKLDPTCRNYDPAQPTK